jgi:polar amino acid transport system substrate-binding protein
MSCSYGPGRYDPHYEEKGFDYPYGYVRWTEKRNMQAFLALIGNKQVEFDHLTTHIFDIADAEKAYELILKKEEPYLGILLKFHPEKPVEKTVRLNGHLKPSQIRIGFIGAGSFAQTYLLPNVRKFNDAALLKVVTANGNTSRTVAEKYGFQFSSTDEREVVEDQEINTVFITTRHNLHASQVIAALQKGKHVFVEKPLALTMEELEQIKEAYQTFTPSEIQNPQSAIPNPQSPIPDPQSEIRNPKSEISNPQSPILMVGFNRRFAPLVKNIKESFQQSPMSIIYRVNAGRIAADHWAQDKVIGGGRIIGEVCHFLDLAMYLTGSLPRSLYAALFPDEENLEDTVSVNVKFKNGSIASIHYFANGSGALEKEYLEVYSRGKTAILKDFKSLEIFSSSKKVYKSRTPDKGHKNEVFEFLKAVKNGEESPISFEEIYYSMWMTFSAVKSIRENKIVNF